MGNGSELKLDFDKLNNVHRDLEEQKRLVESLDLGDAPAASAFGGSDKGQWLAKAVVKGHQNLTEAKKDTVQGLEQHASAVQDAINGITETDEGAALVAKKMADALAVMSHPLVIFDPRTGGKIPMI